MNKTVFTSAIQKLLRIFVFIILVSLASSCGTLTPSLRDDIPPGVPKGYVEFYSGDSWINTPGYRISEGNQSWGCSYLFSPVRFARTPGNYTFRVERENASLRVPVSVQAGMLTPIKINYTSRTEFGWPTRTTHFTIYATVEPYRPSSDTNH
jgi:hypothetical protein